MKLKMGCRRNTRDPIVAGAKTNGIEYREASLKSVSLPLRRRTGRSDMDSLPIDGQK
jgi:hypothetical protein